MTARGKQNRPRCPACNTVMRAKGSQDGLCSTCKAAGIEAPPPAVGTARTGSERDAMTGRLPHWIFCPCHWTESAIEQVETHTAFGFSRLMKLPRRKGRQR